MIISAAVRDRRNAAVVLTAPCQYEAVRLAMRAGVPEDAMEHGFTDSGGRFLGRREAMEDAVASGQEPCGVYDELFSYMLDLGRPAAAETEGEDDDGIPAVT